jgi:hypothetical protein
VGQGLFYDGKIAGFAFVYDCGSIPTQYAVDSVRDYHANLGGTKLNLLVLSHFDQDHISGLDDLLQGLTVDFAVLPYVSPIERLVLALQSPGLQAWVYDFWADPIDYLVNRKGTQNVVIVTGGPERPYEGEFFITGRFDDFELPRIHLDSFRMPPYIEAEEIIKRNEGKSRNYVGNRVLVRSHHGYLNISELWKFRFFTKTPNQHDLEAFRRFLSGSLGAPIETIPGDRIIQIISDSDERNVLTLAYQERFHGEQAVNLTSLVMHHSPTRIKHLRDRYISSEGGYLNSLPWTYRAFSPARRFGHLLTGDIVLKKIWDEFYNHFKDELPMTSGILIPHHGSDNNWDDRLLSVAKNSPVWFVSAGIGNPYRHPSPDIIGRIIRRGHEIRWSHQYSQVFESFEYDPA